MSATPLPGRRDAIALGALSFLLPSALRAQAAPIVTRFVVEDNRMWLGVTVGASKPLLFIVDTGAGTNFLRPEVAQTLGLTAIASRTIGGLGKDRTLSGLVTARDLVIGGSFRQPTVEFQLYDFAGGLPADAAGLLAAGLFTTHDSEIDFAKSEWRLWPGGRPDHGGLAELVSVFDDSDKRYRSRKMEATVWLDGHAYRVLLDTGAPGGLLLRAPAAARSGLFRDEVPFAPQPTSGFGGLAARPSRIVRAKSLQMGPLAIDRPLVTLMDPDLANRGGNDGVLGLPLIRLLTLGTDVRRRKLYAARNAEPVPTFGYRLGGVWLDRTSDGGAVVRAVGTGSPAAAAGLRAGDRLVDPASFDEALRAVAGGPGKEVVLKVQRAGATTGVRYTLAPWL